MRLFGFLKKLHLLKHMIERGRNGVLFNDELLKLFARKQTCVIAAVSVCACHELAQPLSFLMLSYYLILFF